MRIQQQQPSENSVAGEFARQLLTLFGPALQAPDNSTTAAELLAIGGALASARNTTVTSLDEAFANTATQMLSELEASYGLQSRPDLSVEARRTRLLAKIRANRAGSPQGILAAVRTYDPTATIVEVTPDDISPRTGDGLNPGTDRGVYSFAVLLDATVWSDTSKRAEITAIIEQMKPAHVQANIGVTMPFLTDDPDSLTDRDLLGA
jgi:uncharacterized protein YmfQ (DUF2313 family)